MQNAMYKKILVAIDINADYQHILARGLKVAASPADISLLHVTPPEIFFSPYGVAAPLDLASDAREKASEKLTAVASEHGIVKDNTFVNVGHPADEIHSLAEELGCDLIVIGTHGQRGLRLLLGSTANAVLHGVNCDVLVVRV
ncbi:universal stress protein [Alteromonas halophila]|uniref:Universal stress protein n=1 Tax=Alteromonas halophila TaxID=516698 RepID=A0A918JDX6_9ALTE|nr:universal stress protein [Alteromonas halophila]GGW75630.1 universal stress protein [Alteromonas halophila]